MGPLDQLLSDFCDAVGLWAPEILQLREISVKGISVKFDEYSDDPGYFYATFEFGAIFPGRTLRVFRLLLEANYHVYIREQATLGLDAETGGVVLCLREAFGGDHHGPWLRDTLSFLAEHGTYWRENILACPDEMFDGISSGRYEWIKG